MAELWGLVLAGGKSSRMGRSKALLQIGGQRLIDIMVERLVKAVGTQSKVLISGSIDGYAGIPDEHPQQGPLEGLRCSIQKISDGDHLLIVPVDMPLLTQKYLGALQVGLSSEFDYVCYENSELPCLLRITAKLRDYLQNINDMEVAPQQRSFKKLYLSFRGRRIHCDNSRALLNTNTPEDWNEAIK